LFRKLLALNPITITPQTSGGPSPSRR